MVLPILGYVGLGLGGYLAKKAYDAITDDDSCSSSYSYDNSASQRRIKEAKQKRTEVRHQKVHGAIRNHRTRSIVRLRKELFKTYQSKFTCSLSGDTLTVWIPAIATPQSVIAKVGACLGAGNNCSHVQNKLIIHLPPIDSLVGKIVNRANSQYGSMCGINSNDEYISQNDPFLQQLKMLCCK